MAFLRDEELKTLHYMIPSDASVLFLGEFSEKAVKTWGNGSQFVAVDDEVHFNAKVLHSLKNKHFDYIVFSRILDQINDPISLITEVQDRFACSDTKIILIFQNWIWRKLKKIPKAINWTSERNMELVVNSSGLDLIARTSRNICPVSLLGVGKAVNRIASLIPMFSSVQYSKFFVCRKMPNLERRVGESVSIIIPCKNEKGNIRKALEMMPSWDVEVEVIFIEGNSEDGTWDEIQAVNDGSWPFEIRTYMQEGKGKGDAVRLGFEKAKHDILMILDADLTVRPSDLPKFAEALNSGRGEFINGSRMVFPKEAEAMRFLNYLANFAFSVMFSSLLGQRFTDTLCGTKVLRKSDYEKIAANRSYFGALDPFGDFDLIFGAAKLNLKVVEIPIKYRARGYGETQISRFWHGWLLLKMVWKAYFKMRI